MKITASAAILDRLAREHRHVLSDWRALILLRRATFEIPPDQRRWSNLPANLSDISVLLRQMQARGEIEVRVGSLHIFDVTVPYASSNFGDERDLLFEVNPYAALSHLSALVFHGLTDMLPKWWFLTIPPTGPAEILPLGTTEDDWRGVEFPPNRTPAEISPQRAVWIRSNPNRFFGFAEYNRFGYPVRVTTPERTLLDGLLSPEHSGGFVNVLCAWNLAKDSLNLDRLFNQVDRFDIALLRQRVGFILEELGITDPIFDAWSAASRRGGSSRLVAKSPFSSDFSARWNLSLNAPLWPLHDEAA